MVYFPEFWYYGETTSTEHIFHFSESEVEGYHQAKVSLVGAYKASIADSIGCMRSISDTYVSLHQDIEVLRSLSVNRGGSFHIIDWQQHNIIGWMFMARYKTRASQSICGFGPSAAVIYSGSTDSLGTTDTTPETAPLDGGTLVNFLGLEGAWGYVREYIEGIINNTDKLIAFDKGFYSKGTPLEDILSSTKRVLRTKGSSSILSHSGVLVDVIGGEYCDLFPNISKTSSGVSYDQYYCDYYETQDDENLYILRSDSSNFHTSGVFYLSDFDGTITGTVNVGTRLAFDGNITVVENPSTFKSIEDLIFGN